MPSDGVERMTGQTSAERSAADLAWQRIAHYAILVESALTHALGEQAEDDGDVPGLTRLFESMRYSLQMPGKRLRPLLLLASAEAVGASADRFVRFAAGVEMIHAYSLIHDDLPAMDDDTLRRGQPTNHIVYGDGIAILAGDGLLTEAFVAMLAPVTEPGLQMEVIQEIARAAGREGMVGGQAADLMAEGEDPDERTLHSIHSRKTGALILAAVRAGARLGLASEDDLEALGRFAVAFGLAFQIADDIKDEVAPPEITGKHPRGDRAAGKMTYPALHGLEGARARCRAEMERAMSHLAELGPRALGLERLARDAVAPAFASTQR
jgi:geranylgeranyl diphosphate synthase type II